MKILLLTHPMPAVPFAAAIRSRAPELELVEYRPELDVAELAGVEVVLGWQMPRGLAGRMPRLRWVCAVAAGVEKLLADDLAPAVPVSRIVDAEQADGIAQFVVLMALRHARALPLYEAQQREHAWRRTPVAAVRSRVSVLGTGAMGSVVARLLGAVGFEVRGWNRGSGDALEALLGASDIVVCALPLTQQTQGILDAGAFAAMPPGSYLINVARGGHVVEADLIAAVRSGHLAGAALDVQRREPMPPDDPLWDVPGITITPHIAAQPSVETIAAQFVDGIRCLQRGAAPPQAIDRIRGY
jgi:phosphoglycerate dehydrogenase-like enzyme